MTSRGPHRALGDARLRALFALALLAPPLAAIDLARASRTRLDNGLTLLVLEDRTLPVVSVQMLYRAGSRSEENGRTGLAHFLEHMAFRAAENFPDTEVASAIYAVGGEWHGYTWLDETTYFETLPSPHLDLALRIEADRMARLEIPGDQVEAERGAVLAELHGYENDPRAVLKDAVIAVSFQQHPYRNNTIGWPSDVEAIDHRDLVDFYRRHYHPGNAVLAVVGEVSPRQVETRVRELFGSFAGCEPSEPPRTVEPAQTGERRIELHGPVPGSLFEVVYRAPAAGSPDWPAFLVLQEVLGGGEGVNFAQNEWGVAVRPGTRLAGVVDDLSTWYPPMAQPYVFSIAGSIAAGDDPAAIEAAIEARLARLREERIGLDELQAARERLLAELVFDVETTEDAAHQLAYFAGLEALEQLLGLPRAVRAVSADELRQVAARYLQPRLRSVGWYLAGDAPRSPTAGAVRRPPRLEASPPAEPPGTVAGPASMQPASPPVVRRLDGGLPVIVQRVALSPAAYLRLLVPSTAASFPIRSEADDPVWRHTSLDVRFRPDDLLDALAAARRALSEATPRTAPDDAASTDPSRRLHREFERLLGLEGDPPSASPAALILVGDLEAEVALASAAEQFGGLEPAGALPPRRLALTRREVEVTIEPPRAQARLGYLVPAPPPAHADHLAWRLLLYVLTHGYEGRLGKEAISRRGLVYYIASRYPSDGQSAWIALEIGVDPPKLERMRALLVETLAELARRPPTAVELAEGQRHLIGRRQSAHQSNREISAALAAEWFGLGRLRDADEFARAVVAVGLDDLRRVVPAFTSGAVVVVKVGESVPSPAPVKRSSADP